MLRGTRGKDGTSAVWGCDIRYMGDDHLVNTIEHVAGRGKGVRNDIIIDAMNQEIQKRKEDGTRGLIKDTRDWVPSEIRCLKCKEIISSDREGQYKTCSCGEVSIDSTIYYTRIIGGADSYEHINTHIMEGEFSNIQEYHDYVDQIRKERKESTPLEGEAD